eukprot:TRINITY_DN1405_c0_g1_i15.p1 TRINITY_DN1405_c0_g1~~TRINITY_DN1405_c0_g1_i15.p1  ORF type:complete len:335 (-),score=57.98 TRINITY_DN1405_c0_g1_i15:64-1068(-)
MCMKSQEGSFLPVAEKCVESTIFSLSWIPSSARFFTLGTDVKGKGKISIFSLNGREVVESGSALVENSLRCCTLETGQVSDRQVATGDFSGHLAIWDLETLAQEKSVKAHSDVLTCVAGSGFGSSQIVTGGRDGELKLWDTRSLDSPPSLRMAPEAGQARKQCWTVASSAHEDHSTSNYITAGFDNGDIKVFDVRNSKIAWETSLSRGVSKLSILSGREDDSQKSVLVAGTANGKLFQWPLSSPDKMASHQMDKATVWEVQPVSENKKNLVLAALGSGALHVLNLDGEKIETVATHQVSEPPLTGLSANKEKPGLIVTSSFDKTIRVLYYTGLK